MTEERLAWIIRAIMVATAAVTSYLLVQTEVDLDPWVRLVCGAINVALAALNAGTIAGKVTGSTNGPLTP